MLRKFLESIDFNNLSLFDQVSAVFKFVDNVQSVLTWVDGDSSEKLLKDYPRFKLISNKISTRYSENNYTRIKGKLVARSQTNKGKLDVSVESIYQILKKELREENLKNIIKNDN